jgi:glycosyltransferase involved in cell wall biosynthesis
MSNERHENLDAPFQMSLGVIGAPPHWTGADGQAWSYEPYVREMRIWCALFRDVTILCPEGEGEMSGNLAPYQRENVTLRRIQYSLDRGHEGRRKRVVQIFGMVREARSAILDTDFVLLRGYGHFSLIGACWVRLLRRASITKCAGENGAFKGERIPSRLDRRLQNVRSDRNAILVYGPAKGPNQVSFIPALMTEQELASARDFSAVREWVPPWHILCVGRLEPQKEFSLALKGLGELLRLRPDIPWNFTMAGDGTSRQQLEDLARAEGIAERTVFTGALSFDKVQHLYGAAHLVIMPGTKEGWPKIIAEAWAHGAIPVAASAGIVPYILQEPESGVVFAPEAGMLAEALSRLLDNPAQMKVMSSSLYRRAGELSLEQFKRKVMEVLCTRFHLPVQGRGIAARSSVALDD